MKKILSIIAIISLVLLVGCTNKHDGVDDEYSRGFFNALSIMEHNYSHSLHKDSSYYEKLPYWNECKRSYEKKQDLYNYWDSSYSYSKR